MPKKTWRSEFKRLWNELVPSQGQAKTVQGELIRAAGRLSDEAYRNGNINFDKGHRIMCKYLRANLDDPTVFSAEEIAEINECIDQILDASIPIFAGQHLVTTASQRRWCNGASRSRTQFRINRIPLSADSLQSVLIWSPSPEVPQGAQAFPI